MPCLRLTVALVGLCLLTAGCKKNESAAEAKPKASASKAKPAQLDAAQRQFIGIETVSAGGTSGALSLPARVTFRTQAQSAVGATTSGRVVAVLVQAGQIVKAGAPLLTIDSADAASARAALDQAASRESVAENTYKRQVVMMEKGVGLEFERQEAEARLKEARSELDRARHAVSVIGAGQGIHVSVRAPANGVVMSVRAAVGATVAPGGEALVEIGDPSRLQVVAQVPESDLRRVAVGQQADVELPALGARMPARVESFSPRVDLESRRTQVYLSLTKQPEGLRAGMMAQVTLRVTAEAGLSIPVAAVLIKDGKRRVVYVARDDGTFEAREVEVGRTQEGRATILKGLFAGEKIVVRGGLLLDTQAEQLL